MGVRLGLVAVAMLVASLVVVADVGAARAADPVPTAAAAAGPGYWRYYLREARKLRDYRLRHCRTQRCRTRAWDAYHKAEILAGGIYGLASTRA